MTARDAVGRGAVRAGGLGTWFRVHPASGPAGRLRLICLPPAGAGIGTFHAWPALVPPWLELDLVKLPGRDTRFGEPLPGDLHRLVRMIRKETAVLVGQDEVPYVLFGHSMGGVLAYEIAAALQTSGVRPPVLVIVSGIVAPDDVVRQVRMIGKQDPVDLVRELSGVAGEILDRPELLQVFAPALAADMGMLHIYQPSHQVLDSSLMIFHAAGDPRTEFADVGAWARWTRAEFGQQVFSGGHHYPSEQPEPVVSAVVELTEQHLTG